MENFPWKIFHGNSIHSIPWKLFHENSTWAIRENSMKTVYGISCGIFHGITIEHHWSP